jgi:60 kDa SS-A/Ro ribonucleoprotein
LTNVPEVPGTTYVAVDNSGSMGSPVTGHRGSATSVIRCLDAAAVLGSALLRRNPNNVNMLAFNTSVVRENFNGRDSVLTNVEKLQRLPGGGTDCSCVLRDLNDRNVSGVSAVIYVSDDESWVEYSSGSYRAQRGTGTMQEWNIFKRRNPNAKLVCIDIQPYGTSQAVDREDILNVGGYSDSVFTVIDMFLRNQLTAAHWVGTINKIEI